MGILPADFIVKGIKMGHYKQIQIQGQRYTLHRYLMEQHIGRKLLPNEIVHHIDNNKYNNQIGNLKIRNRRRHNIASGQTNRPGAKLNKDDVVVIKKMLKDGIRQWLIAYIYEVGRAAIGHIDTGKNWAWI